MKQYFLSLLIVITPFFASSHILHQGKQFELNDLNYSINNAQDYTFEASEKIKLKPQSGNNPDFEYHARSSNKTFIGRIDLNIVTDVTIQAQNSSNIFSPSNGRNLEENKAVGKIPASHNVDKAGGFHYNIPIEIPPGTNGVTPSLLLSYSSNSESSMLGLGWNVSGLSSIDRTSKVLYYDDVNEPIKFDKWYPGEISKTYVREGTILNHTTFLITKSYQLTKSGSKNLNKKEEVYHFKKFNPKPDSTNNFIK